MVSMTIENANALASDSQGIALAEAAAEQLFYATDRDTIPVYEPAHIPAAQAAIRRLGKLFEDHLRGVIGDALEAAQDSGELLSNDRLQGIAEVIQNADDGGCYPSSALP